MYDAIIARPCPRQHPRRHPHTSRIYESLVVCEYIEEVFGRMVREKGREQTLLPAGLPEKRALVRIWIAHIGEKVSECV